MYTRRLTLFLSKRTQFVYECLSLKDDTNQDVDLIQTTFLAFGNKYMYTVQGG